MRGRPGTPRRRRNSVRHSSSVAGLTGNAITLRQLHRRAHPLADHLLDRQPIEVPLQPPAGEFLERLLPAADAVESHLLVKLEALDQPVLRLRDPRPDRADEVEAFPLAQVARELEALLHGFLG